MLKRLILLAALLASPAKADTLVTNVNGIQVGADGKLQRFRALTFGDDGKVRNVIENPELVRLANITATIDGGGKTLLPGLIDAHGHVMDLGFAALQLDLNGTRSLADLQERLKDYAGRNPGIAWIVGRGWNQEMWADKRFPAARDLDQIVSDRPVVLERVDGHAVVANGAALKAAGITRATRNPAGGRIEKDVEGNVTGLLVDTAAERVTSKIPVSTEAQRDEAFAEAQRILLSNGLTSVTDMGSSDEDVRVLLRACASGRSSYMRVISYLTPTSSFADRPNPHGPWLCSERFSLVGVKIYADGALGSRGAWLKRPYADAPQMTGLQFLKNRELDAQLEKAASLGLQPAVHAIGDAANAQIISAFERLAEKFGPDRRWRIEHAQVIDPADISRLARAGIIASMQPVHQTSDRTMAEARLDPPRLKGAYAWQTIAKSGARLAFGSDFPVESPNPFPGLAAAISRMDPKGQPPGGWRPEERVSFEQALSGFTRDAAYASFAESRIGSLEPGKWADFIIVDRDPTKVNAQELARTRVLETWVGGVKMFDVSAPTPAK